MRRKSNLLSICRTILCISVLVYICKCESEQSCESNRSEKIRKIDLVHLGKNITETIKHPTGTADGLIENILKYYEALEIIHKDMKNGVKEAISAFHELKNQGGPPFLSLCPIDDKPLERFYRWAPYHRIEFRGFIKYNEDEWYEMNEYANKSALAIY